MFMHRDDAEDLQKMLGGEIPEAVKEEYSLRATLFHKCGANRLGALALVDLVRFVGIVPKAAQEKKEVVDWRKFPPNETIRVSLPGDRIGRYGGMVSGGILAIRVEGDPQMREFRAYEVGIAPPESPAPEPIPARELLEGAKDAKRSKR